MSNTTKVFRFKFSQTILEQMQEFARIHKFDQRTDFKEAWETWIQNNKTMIQEENTRLCQCGFTGDIHDKMYKSVRYYYSKKSNSKQEPKKRRKYITIDKEILANIDRHITNSIESNDSFKPSDGFKEFIDLNYDSILPTFEKTELTRDDIDQKLKKTYKNRYFLISNKE